MVENDNFLENSGDKKKIDQLLADLNAPSVSTRHEAVRAIASRGESAIEPLIRELEGAKDNDRRWYAAMAISGIGAAAVAPLLSHMKVQKDTEFRRYAAAALGTIGIPAIEPIIEAMASDDRQMLCWRSNRAT